MTKNRKKIWYKKRSKKKQLRARKIEAAVTMLLEAIGEDPNRPGLKDTPFRVAKMYAEELCSGYGVDTIAILREAVFTAANDDLVIVKDIPFYSLCEHHILPFLGKVHIAYIPDQETREIAGLSKFARVVEAISRKLQLQEDFTFEIATTIQEGLCARGVAVIVESSEHTCMTMRGIQKPGTHVTTSTMLGVFRKDAKARQEVLGLLSK